MTYTIKNEYHISESKKPSNRKADTKNIGYHEINFFDWKIQIEKSAINKRS